MQSDVFVRSLLCRVGHNILITGHDSHRRRHRSADRTTNYVVLTVRFVNKCSAVAEMGDRLATIDMGRKVGGCAPCFFGVGSWVSI